MILTCFDSMIHAFEELKAIIIIVFCVFGLYLIEAKYKISIVNLLKGKIS